ncbi:MAG: hypothetical protein RIM99_15915 [Cyclobacteriaceae bacterium]
MGLIIPILLFISLVGDSPVAIVNGVKIYQKVIEVSLHDQVILLSNSEGPWHQIKPIPKEYDNLSSGVKPITDIEYEVLELSKTQSLNVNELRPGTFHFINGDEFTEYFSSSKPLTSSYPQVIKLIVREEDSYVGYLTEQLGLPFIIPPKTLPGIGHQTDLQIGTDCAELAIYGRRRQGFKIEYGGPRGIRNHLVETNQIFPGLILHFGHQVSILYKDFGKIGQIDDEDLLIHAYQDKVQIQRFGDTDLFGDPYQTMTWK